MDQGVTAMNEQIYHVMFDRFNGAVAYSRTEIANSPREAVQLAALPEENARAIVFLRTRQVGAFRVNGDSISDNLMR